MIYDTWFQMVFLSMCVFVCVEREMITLCMLLYENLKKILYMNLP